MKGVKQVVKKKNFCLLQETLKTRVVDHVDIAMDECSPHHYKVTLILVLGSKRLRQISLSERPLH